MDTIAARKIREGDVVSYEGRPQRVSAVVEAGLWAPYFELPEAGLISHRLVQPPGRKPREAESWSEEGLVGVGT